jgi:hypothetical protein
MKLLSWCYAAYHKLRLWWLRQGVMLSFSSSALSDKGAWDTFHGFGEKNYTGAKSVE